MQTVRGLFAPLPELRTPVATIGAFDGVHRGHQAVLAETARWACELGGHSLVVTFDPLPKAVVGQGEAVCLTSLEHRLLLLGRCGLDVAVVLAFDATLAQMSPEAFVEDVLLGWLGTRHVVLGFNSTFGRGGRGNAELLRQFEARGRLEARSPAPVRHGGEIISSTAIRAAVGSGGLDQAAAMLGRPFALFGTVVRGDGRGRRYGFPTANLDLHHEAAPPNGVYATIAVLDGVRRPALTYIGPRPTFEPAAQAPAFEVHIIDFAADLYGRDVEVEFVQRLRGDIRFASADALVAQMHADREAALALCHQRGPA